MGYQKMAYGDNILGGSMTKKISSKPQNHELHICPASVHLMTVRFNKKKINMVSLSPTIQLLYRKDFYIPNIAINLSSCLYHHHPINTTMQYFQIHFSKSQVSYVPICFHIPSSRRSNSHDQ